jgi:HNH endonuclease
MCDGLGQPTSVAEAMAMLGRALDHLNAADAASLPGAVQADVLRQTMLRLAADAMSGPGGLAAWLRHAQLSGTPGGSVSQPLAIPLSLDTGEAEPVVPPALRRAVLTRHRHCSFPGCQVPATACHIHHYIPRSQGGRTALGNLGPVCAFHHLIVVHTWGWTLALGADGTVTATSPYGRTLRDHDPPSQAA